jgi:hypothetical protein
MCADTGNMNSTSSTQKVYYAVEFGPIKPTTNFDRAVKAASAEADKRQAPVTLYQDGRTELIVYPAVSRETQEDRDSDQRFDEELADVMAGLEQFAPDTVVAGPFFSDGSTGVGIVKAQGRELWTRVGEGYVPVLVVVGDRCPGGYRAETLVPVPRLRPTR